MKSGEIVKYVLYFLVISATIGLLVFVLWPKKPLPKPIPVNPPVGPLPPPQPVYPIVPPLPTPTPAPGKKEKEYFVVGLAKKPTITTYDPKELNDIITTFGAEKPKRPVQVNSPGGVTKYWSLPDAKGEQWGSNPAWGVTSKGQPTTFLLKQGPYTAEIVNAPAGTKPVGYIVYGIKPTQAELKAAKYQSYTVLPYYVPMTPQEQKVQTSVWSRNDICIQPYPVANRTSISRNYKCLNNQTLSLAVSKCQSDDGCKGFSLNEKTGQACYYGLVAQNPQPMADTQFYSKCQFQMAS